MKILIVNNTKIPALKYGGTERVIWSLGKALHRLGHEIHYLVEKGSECSFATVHEINPALSVNEQIPENIDIVHLNFQSKEKITKPYITTFHGNVNTEFSFDINTVFISQNQAARFHANEYVHNGLDWDEYDKPILNNTKKYFHFLGDAAWSVKNVKGAIAVTKAAHEKLIVLGGTRINFNMGFKFFPQLHVRFKGMVGGSRKNQILQHSKGLVFPVLWHEPFGLAIIESLFYGCPVFGTTYGSLPELVPSEMGFLSNSIFSLANAIHNSEDFNKKICHDYAVENFSASVMAENYLRMYHKVLNGNAIQASQPFFDKKDITPKKLPMNP
jgi:glycosyltransferase involved in cell wall biosynthesis